MKIYAAPIDAPEPDYSNYDFEAERAKNDQYLVDLKAKLQDMGYTGEWTGEIYRSQIADGYAQYMVAQPAKGAGSPAILIHIATSDSYHDPDTAFVPFTEVKKRIQRDKKLADIFAAKRAEQ